MRVKTLCSVRTERTEGRASDASRGADKSWRSIGTLKREIQRKSKVASCLSFSPCRGGLSWTLRFKVCGSPERLRPSPRSQTPTVSPKLRISSPSRAPTR